MDASNDWIVFRVRYRIESGLTTPERNAVIEAFITEAIEGNDLQFGGGGSGDWWSGVAEPHSTNAATEAQRRAVEAWLQRHPRIVESAVSPLMTDAALSRLMDEEEGESATA